uniref:FBD domain-containing protein n=1 Tax=Aegilops tauschii TaxID=37682 RepID=N1QYB8_AEGTA
MVSSPRCPALRELCIARAWGVVSLCIISQTLERLELDILHGLEELTVVAPMLRALNVHACFAWRKPVAAIYASRLEVLWWSDAFDPSFVLFGEVENLQQLTTFDIHVYGRFDYALLQDYVMLLQHFPTVSCLDLKLNYQRDLSQYEYLMGIITKLPNIKILSLWLHTKGHAIGPSVFHLLSKCPGIRELKLTLLDNLQVKL